MKMLTLVFMSFVFNAYGYANNCKVSIDLLESALKVNGALDESTREKFLPAIKTELLNLGYSAVATGELGADYMLTKQGDPTVKRTAEKCLEGEGIFSYKFDVTVPITLYKSEGKVVKDSPQAGTGSSAVPCKDRPASQSADLQKQGELKARAEAIIEAIKKLPKCGN